MFDIEFDIEEVIGDLFEYHQMAGFDPAEGESKTSVHIVSTKGMSDRERQRWEEMKRNAVDVEFEEIKL